MTITSVELNEEIFKKAVDIGTERQNRNIKAGRGNASHYRAIAGQASDTDLLAHIRGCLGEAAWHQFFLMLEDAVGIQAGKWTTGFAWNVSEHKKYSRLPDLQHFNYDIEVKTISKPYNNVGLKRKDVDAGKLLAVAYPHVKDINNISKVVDLIGVYDLSLIRDMPHMWEGLSIPFYDRTGGENCREIEQAKLMSPSLFSTHLLKNTKPIFKHFPLPTPIKTPERNPFWD